MTRGPRKGHNGLHFLYDQLLPLSKTFRDAVCHECGWSEATFYRKARGNNTFSIAELEKIKSIFISLLKNLISQEKYILDDISKVQIF